MNRVYHLKQKINANSPRNYKRYGPGNSPGRSPVPRLNLKSINRVKNPSIEIIETIFRLPKIQKKCDIQFEDYNFIFKYHEDRKSIKLNYFNKTAPGAGEL